jgi:PhnB protein
MKIDPYLFFDGNCAAAIEFYKDVLGAEVEMLMRYRDSPEPLPPGMLPFSLSMSVPDADTADRIFGALAEGGEVQMPLDQTFWSPRFGMLKDRYGVQRMINQEGQAP